MKVNLFITRCREQVQDEVPDAAGKYRWSDGEFFRNISDALRWLWANIPEAFFVDEIVTTAPTEITGAKQDIPVIDEYINPLIQFVCARILSQDAEESGNMAVTEFHNRQRQAEA